MRPPVTLLIMTFLLYRSSNETWPHQEDCLSQDNVRQVLGIGPEKWHRHSHFDLPRSRPG